MKHTYKTSLLMSNFNYGLFLEEALQSVFSQTVPFDEVIIVDDGSTDSSLEVINAFVKDRSNIKLISQSNQGQLSCINTGFASCSGDIIYFLDSDDVFTDRYLEKTLSHYQKFEDCDFLFTAVQEFGNSDEMRIFFKDYCTTTGNIGFSLLRTLYGKELIGVPTSTISIKRDILEKIVPFKNYEDWKICADDCLAYGTSLAGARKYVITEPIVRYRIHDRNQWASQERSKSDKYLKTINVNRLISSISQELNLTGDFGNLILKEFRSLPNKNYTTVRFYLNLTNRSRMYHKDKVIVRKKILTKYLKNILNRSRQNTRKQFSRSMMEGPNQKLTQLDGKKRNGSAAESHGSTSLKVSIITVCKNAENIIEESIQSVLSQSYENVEYIVIDGASTDNTGALLENYGNRISYYVSEKDHGIYNAMNKGIKVATGDIIFFLNAGDTFFDEFVLQKVVEVFSKADIEFLYGDIIYNDGVSEKRDEFNHVDKAFFLDKNLCHQSIFYKSEAFSKYGYFDEKYSVLADYEWNVRGFLNYRIKSGHIGIPTAKYRLDGISSVADKKQTEIRRQQRRRLKHTYYSKFELMVFRRFLKTYIRALNKSGLTKGKLMYVKLFKLIFRFNLYHKPIEF